MPRDILDAPPPAGAERIPYGEAGLHFGDLRVPSSSGPHPAIIFLHGGFWRNHRTLDYAGHLCASLQAAGVATWNVEFRRVGDTGGGWPGTAADALDGARFFTGIAESRGIDLKRVAIAGHSAGGHLALWVAAQGAIDLTLAISLGGVVDLHRACELNLGDGAVQQFLGATPQQDPQRYREACPIELLPVRVPQLLIHGTADDIVPLELSQRFASKSVNAELLELDGADHFDVIDTRSAYWPRVLNALLHL